MIEAGVSVIDELLNRDDTKGVSGSIAIFEDDLMSLSLTGVTKSGGTASIAPNTGVVNRSLTRLLAKPEMACEFLSGVNGNGKFTGNLCSRW